MSRFNQVRFLISAAAPAQFPPDHGSEVAFVGRSNAGKSSAINAITQRHGLARTSKTPGRTQLLNFFELAPGRRLVDLPGYGYASAPAQQRSAWPPLIDALRGRSSLKGLFVIVDARRGLQEGDAGLLDWALPAHRVHVLLSKADKLNRAEGAAALRSATQALAGRASVQLFSALKGGGVQQAQDTLEEWLGQGRQ
ncbi:MAG: YihA family ribosome biogenesis GTP-binding protein [Proteobacteria bacterium]|nr:YihA family ribosome biogenesis GTP-binding protein [Pseudomonadota bacterium]